MEEMKVKETIRGPESIIPIRITTICDGRHNKPDFSIALLANEGSGEWREIVSIKHPETLVSLRRWWNNQ